MTERPLLSPARLDRLHTQWERTLVDTCTAHPAPNWAAGESFACAIREEGSSPNQRLDMDAGNAGGYRLRVSRTAPALKAGDRVKVRGITLQVLRVYPPATQAPSPSYGCKVLQ